MWVITQGDGEIHVTPIDDLCPHLHSKLCWCSPSEEGDESDVWTHHSMDGREAYETGERALS